MARLQTVLPEWPLDWLLAVLFSWVIPFELITTWRVTYGVSLLLWVIPIILLLPRLFAVTDRGGRRRRAIMWTVVYIFAGGTLLDVIFGAVILRFSNVQTYWLPVPALGGEGWIPVEELIFYLTGGLAIVLVYFWSDEFWLHAYNIRQRRPLIPTPGYLVDVSWNAVIAGGALMALGIAAKRVYHGAGPWLPAYFTFLVLVAFVPAVVLYRGVKDLVNWRAFSFTMLYVLLTAAVWEVTLGLPRRWWGYRPAAMLGKYVPAWGTPDWPYPIEALFVWLVVSFAVVLLYEAIKAYHYDPRAPRAKLFGPKNLRDLARDEEYPIG
jgi:hypothetical protein